MEFIVRGVGLIKNAAELEQIVLLEREGTPVYLRDVARVEIGGDFRRGVLDVDGREVVGGMVVMRTGENAHDVIRRVKEKIAQISAESAARRDDQRILRSQRADRSHHRDAEARAHGRNHPRDARAHHLPVSLPIDPDRHPAAAGVDSHLLHS